MWVVSARYQIAAEASRPMPPTLVPLQVVLAVRAAADGLAARTLREQVEEAVKVVLRNCAYTQKTVPARVSEITVL